MRIAELVGAAAIVGAAAETNVVFPTVPFTKSIVEDAAARSGKSFEHFVNVLDNTETLDVPRFRNEFIQFVGVQAEKMLGEQMHEFKRPNATAVEFAEWNFFPHYLAHVGGSSNQNHVSFSSPCFAKNDIYAKPSSDGKTIDLTWVADSPSSEDCTDDYVMATVSGHAWHTVRRAGTQRISWELPETATSGDLWDQQVKGVRVFRYRFDYVTTLHNVLATLPLFVPEFTKHVPKRSAEVNVEFMKNYAGFEMAPRDGSVNKIVPETQIHSGDAFYIIRLDGLDPMLAWAMGSTTGHTTMAMWMDGELYVVESTVVDSYWPTNGIQATPYRKWVEQAQMASFNVVHAPLSSDARKKFDHKSAEAWVKQSLGLNYGYKTLLFGWLDTLNDNFPCVPDDYSSNCLNKEYWEVLMGLLDHAVPQFADTFWTEALNNRLGTDGLRTSEAFVEADKQGYAPYVVPTLPELDTYLYEQTRDGVPSGKDRAMVCCVFACSVWKAGGLFDGLDVNCGEQTNWDTYSMEHFAPTYTQMLGDYTLTLNNYNSRVPYDHMSEHCESHAPDFTKTPGC